MAALGSMISLHLCRAAGINTSEIESSKGLQSDYGICGVKAGTILSFQDLLTGLYCSTVAGYPHQN